MDRANYGLEFIHCCGPDLPESTNNLLEKSVPLRHVFNLVVEALHDREGRKTFVATPGNPKQGVPVPEVLRREVGGQSAGAAVGVKVDVLQVYR